MPISKGDIANYPFTREASEYVTTLNLSINELSSPDYIRIVERSEQRIDDALIYGIVKTPDPLENDIEIFSFPVAVLLIAKINNEYLKRRYALAEAVRAYEVLIGDDNSKIVEIARTTFGWKTRIGHGNRFILSLVDYLRNSTNFHDNKWKLINRRLVEGEVLLGKNEFARLLQEEIRKHIESVIDKSPKNIELNASLLQVSERINQILAQRRKEAQIELPKNAVISAYPPCIKKLYDSLLTGGHVSHMGRFTLTSFLLNIGMKTDDLTKLYTSFSDFDEEQTRYQIKHIAGETGSRQKYKPPQCSTLKTHNLCINTDKLCTRVRHPLSYYERKLELVKKTSEEK